MMLDSYVRSLEPFVMFVIKHGSAELLHLDIRNLYNNKENIIIHLTLQYFDHLQVSNFTTA